MRTLKNRRWLFVERPQGEVTERQFQLETVPVPELQEGQVLVRHEFLSVDPYMRGRMDDVASYAPPQALGQVMVGRTVGTVLESRREGFRSGDMVAGLGGWQEYSISDGSDLRLVDVSRVSASAWLGVIGTPGLAAWIGVQQFLRPVPGETVVVSAAAGAAGSVAGQLARLAGCRVIGIAGGPQNCQLVQQEYGFDACIDYKAEDVGKALVELAPDGIDCLFENVGGRILDAALANMAAFSRIALCGLIAGYSGQPIPMHNVYSLLVNRIQLRGFIITDHMDLWPTAFAELAGFVADGAVKCRETITKGIDNAPAAFMSMMKGNKVGKQLVQM